MEKSQNEQSKFLSLYAHGREWKLRLRKNTYVNNGNLYLGLENPEYGHFADLTVNIEDLPDGLAAVDTNNCPWAEEFITSHRLGDNTFTALPSGFCVYPIYAFDMERINELL